MNNLRTYWNAAPASHACSRSALVVLRVTVLSVLLPITTTASGQCEDWLAGPLIDQPQGFDTNGIASASAIWTLPGGPTLLVVGGSMTSAGGVPVNNLAAWDGASWRDLGGGVIERLTKVEP